MSPLAIISLPRLRIGLLGLIASAWAIDCDEADGLPERYCAQARLNQAHSLFGLTLVARSRIVTASAAFPKSMSAQPLLVNAMSLVGLSANALSALSNARPE